MSQPAAPDKAGGKSQLLRNPMLGKAAIALAVYEGTVQLVDRAQGEWRNRFAYTVSVTENDPIYAGVHSWLLTVLPTDRHRSLMVGAGSSSRRGGLEAPDPDVPDQVATPLQLMFNDQRPRRVVVDGHRMTVEVDAQEVRSTDREMKPDKITFTTRTYAGQQAVVAHLRRIHDQRRTDRPPVLRMVNQWGSWRKRTDLPPRTLESVILPAGQRDRIAGDLGRFLAEEDTYNRLAIPWHRGYMFHGPPGTGKTSLVKALANEFSLDLWYVSLSDLTAESSLMGLLSDVGPRSMLLLEDIDTVEITHQRETQQGKISMSSLLNALDGVATPHGLVTVMTTNHFDRLDPALTRAGRMDLVEKLDYPTPSSVRALYRHFYETEFHGALPDASTTSQAAIAEALKRHLDDPAAGADALTQLCQVGERR